MAFCIFLSVKTGLDVICRPVPSRKVEVVAIAGGFVLEEVIARVSSIIVREEWCRFLPNLKPNAVVLLVNKMHHEVAGTLLALVKSCVFCKMIMGTSECYMMLNPQP